MTIHPAFANLSPERRGKGIYWQRSWNVVRGCSKVSSGCDHCWLEAETARHAKHPNPKIATPCWPAITADKWSGNVHLDLLALPKPLTVKKPTVWAVWSDLFHESVSFTDIAKVFAVMSLAELHGHLFVLLTKRPQIMKSFLGRFEQDEVLRAAAFESMTDLLVQKCPWPMRNVILMTTIEDQPRADERAPIMAELGGLGWRTGVSIEPMLGPVDVSPFLQDIIHQDEIGLAGRNGPLITANGITDHDPWLRGLSWIIAGGETGPGARPMHPDWLRSLRDQCAAAGVPFLLKGWGEWGTSRAELGTGVPAWDTFSSFEHYCAKAHTRMVRGDKLICPDGHVPTHGGKEGKTFPMAITTRVGKRAAGRLLDGITHDAYPQEAA